MMMMMYADSLELRKRFIIVRRSLPVSGLFGYHSLVLQTSVPNSLWDLTSSQYYVLRLIHQVLGCVTARLGYGVRVALQAVDLR